MRQLNDQSLEVSIAQYDQSKYTKFKSNLAMNLIAQSFSICLNKETFSFQNEKILVLNICMASNHFGIKINQNMLEFSKIKPIKFISQEIQTFYLNFLSNQQLTPSYSINENLFLLIAPKILIIPQLSIPQISLFNTNQKDRNRTQPC